MTILTSQMRTPSSVMAVNLPKDTQVAGGERKPQAQVSSDPTSKLQKIICPALYFISGRLYYEVYYELHRQTINAKG